MNGYCATGCTTPPAVVVAGEAIAAAEQGGA